MFIALITHSTPENPYYTEKLGEYATEAEATKSIVSYASKIIVQLPSHRCYQLLNYSLKKNDLNKAYTIRQLNNMYGVCRSETALRALLISHKNQYFENSESEYNWSFMVYDTSYNYNKYDRLFDSIINIDVNNDNI